MLDSTISNSPVNYPLVSGSLLEAQVDRTAEWLWHGYLLRGGLTLLTGQWKIGKTTLLAALLARLGRGGDLAGRRVAPGRAVVLTEEMRALWAGRLGRFGIGDWVSFAIRPFVQKPRLAEWQALLDQLTERHRDRPIDLLVIDPLTGVLSGREESSAAAMTEMLRPLREFTAHGPAVLILHHPRKGRSVGGQGARGTGALPAFVDILLEINWPGSAVGVTRRRWLTGWSRFDETPRKLLLEWSPEKADYAVVPATVAGPVPLADDAQAVLENLLRTSPGLTARELAECWPTGTPRLGSSGMNRRLLASVHAGRLTRTGSGTRFSPHRYWMAEESEEALPAEDRGNGP